LVQKISRLEGCNELDPLPPLILVFEVKFGTLKKKDKKLLRSVEMMEVFRRKPGTPSFTTKGIDKF